LPAGDDLAMPHEEQAPLAGWQRPINGHRHRLTELLAPAGVDDE
jgi:hypothetical protein